MLNNCNTTHNCLSYVVCYKLVASNGDLEKMDKVDRSHLPLLLNHDKQDIQTFCVLLVALNSGLE